MRTVWLFFGLALAAAACGSDSKGLDDFLPDIPDPTGEPQSVFAGQIADESELVTGPAQSGTVGDYFIRNSRARFVIQAESRLIGVVPQGGNLVDAAPVDASGNQLLPDHFGELSMIYVLGRTCEHESIEVVQDGSGGGVAAIRARGKTAANDFISIRGIGLFNVTPDQDPDIDDGLECATTYILAPDSPTIQVYWTLFNPSDENIRGPFGSFADTGGVVAPFSPTRGFEALGLESLATGSQEAPIPYTVYQGPEVAYGIMPRHEDPATSNAAAVIAGVSVVLYGADELLDILDRDSFFLELLKGDGVTMAMDVVVGADAADAEQAYREGRGEAVAELSGQVSFDSGEPAAGARVGLFLDGDGDGEVGPEDTVVSYIDADADGNFAGSVPPGNYLLRADVLDQGRSAASAVDLVSGGVSNVSISVADPVLYDYSIVNDVGGENIPAKLTVVGRHPAAPDLRLHPLKEVRDNVIGMTYALRGSTTDLGAGADPRIALPPGSDYRILASRGTEWSVASVLVSPQAGDPPSDLTFTLRQVAPAAGYVASEYHVHSIGSPDSAVDEEVRVATAVADGVELFASTDHDYVGVLQPLIEALGLERVVRSIPGIEVTPFAYGHFNAWPIEPIFESPNRGAIDWARNDDGFALIPEEIFSAMRDRGAELVQVNHPRGVGGFSDFQQYFDRAELSYDYDARVISGDLLAQPVPNEWIRLAPEDQLWSDGFNALEVWNGFSPSDTDGDGVREMTKLDVVLRDWFNFLSFGMQVTPLGNSDTHTAQVDPMGMPRTYVRVGDDSPEALASGAVVDDVIDTLAGRADTPIDVVVTNGPHVQVSVDGNAQPLGDIIDGGAGSIEVTVTVTSPDWAVFDTIEIFANATPDIDGTTVLEPLVCFTSRDPGEVMASDPCALAPAGGAQPMTVETVTENGFDHFEATVTVTIAAGDIVNREGATGGDAWFVVRARGDRAIYPLLLSGLLGDADVDAFVAADSPADLGPLLDGRGVPAAAFTAPFYVDFDGGGYLAPFRP